MKQLKLSFMTVGFQIYERIASRGGLFVDVDLRN